LPDFMTPQQRSHAMSRVKGRDTGLEKEIRNKLDQLGIPYEVYRQDLPGKPDIVFSDKKTVIFIDGDFWHGYRFPTWQDKIPPFWQKKIGDTRLRDRRNFAKLRRLGWNVMRIWQHQIKNDINLCIDRIVTSLNNV
jgi:DNA mismatch endonuclease (patch repair protein)